jgi:hypothetical protein
LAAEPDRTIVSAEECPLTTERRHAPRYPVALEISVDGGTGVTINGRWRGVVRVVQESRAMTPEYTR